MITTAATGFFTAFSLILAIGAQNAFVLRQGVLRQHVFALCLLCAVSDAILITLGVAGFGWLVSLNPRFPEIMSLGGAAFLMFYGGSRFWAAYQGNHDVSGLGGAGSTFWPTILTGLALTWLNPHVYLDTLGLIGAVSSQFITLPEKVVFALAAIAASFTFFFSLGYGARLLAPIMQTVRAWQIFDVLIGFVMLMIAFGLVASTL
jgi:L-lysine exporter family protein LysE/ArgO